MVLLEYPFKSQRTTFSLLELIYIYYIYYIYISIYFQFSYIYRYIYTCTGPGKNVTFFTSITHFCGIPPFRRLKAKYRGETRTPTWSSHKQRRVCISHLGYIELPFRVYIPWFVDHMGDEMLSSYRGIIMSQ